MVCSFCNLNESEGWLKSYCKPCADLRRMLILYDPLTCADILNRCLLRTPEQITHKINAELKKKVVSEIKKNCDQKDYDKV